MRGARLERAPGVFVDGGDAHVDHAVRRARDVEQNIGVAYHHRSLRHESDRCACARQQFERCPRQAVVAFNRLVRVGRGAERDLLSLPRRSIELATEHLREVGLDENDRRKFVARVHLELGVIAPGETVVTAVGAATIGIERPPERHAFDAVQRRSAPHLLIARGIGATFRLGQCRRSALADEIGHVSGGRLASQVEEEWMIVQLVERNGESFAVCSPMMSPTRWPRVKRRPQVSGSPASSALNTERRPGPCRAASRNRPSGTRSRLAARSDMMSVYSLPR